MARTNSSAARPGSVRVIGGELRGRRLPIADHPALRPTPDRVRETLFNWLQPEIAGIACLDLFAGTGVLGIEALSRGAATAAFVEADPVLVAALESRLGELGLLPRAAVRRARVEDTLRAPAAQRYGLVFLDPPYALPLAPLLALLREWVLPAGLVYVERPAAVELPITGPGWERAKAAQAGRLSFGLLRLAEPA